MLDAGDLGAGIGRAAGGDQDGLCSQPLAGRDQTYRMGVLQHRTARDDFDVRALERRRIGELEPRYLAILVGDQLRPVERRFVQGPAVTRGVLEVVGKTCRVDQQFLGNAAADHAGAADAKLLRHHDARAIAGSDPRRAHTARAGSDDEEIDLLIGHVVLSNQPRSRSSEGNRWLRIPRTFVSKDIASSICRPADPLH